MVRDCSVAQPANPAPNATAQAADTKRLIDMSILPSMADFDTGFTGMSTRQPHHCHRADCTPACNNRSTRSEEHTSELQSLMRISYAVFCLKKKNNLIKKDITYIYNTTTTTNTQH